MARQRKKPAPPDTSSPPDDRYFGALREAVIGVLANATEALSLDAIYREVESLTRGGAPSVRAALHRLEAEGLVERPRPGLFRRTWDWDGPAPAGGAPSSP